MIHLKQTRLKDIKDQDCFVCYNRQKVFAFIDTFPKNSPLRSIFTFNLKKSEFFLKKKLFSNLISSEGKKTGEQSDI